MRINHKSNFILLPHFSISDKNIIFLKKYVYLRFKENIDLNNSLHFSKLVDKHVVVRKKNFMADKKQSALIIEPHPDDFALSALGWALDKNLECNILNIFPDTSMRYFPWRQYLDNNRDRYCDLRIEESKFSNQLLLGYSFSSLMLKSIRFCTRKSDRYQDTLKTISSKILEEIEKHNYDYLLFPMSVGDHPDHVIVYESLLDVYKTACNKPNHTILYEEYPYCTGIKATNKTRDKINSHFRTKDITINIGKNIGYILDSISCYRSQFEDLDLDITIKNYKNFFESRNLDDPGFKQSKFNYMQKYVEILGKK